MRWTILRILQTCRNLWRGRGLEYTRQTPALRLRTGRKGRMPPSNSGLVDTEQALSKVLDTLKDLPSHPPSLYVDLEGIRLSWTGNISILQLQVLPTSQTYLVDVFTLKERAFNTASSYGHTLKDILESPFIPKVFFDVRSDSNALYGQFNVSLRNVHDLQLMELASRTLSGKYVRGLAKCIEHDADLATEKLTAWKANKQRARELFTPECGGTYTIFNERPLSENIRAYCVEDVQFLPRLWEIYNTRLTTRWERAAATWRQRVEAATKDRIRLTQISTHDISVNPTLAPDGWYKSPRG